MSASAIRVRCSSSLTRAGSKMRARCRRQGDGQIARGERVAGVARALDPYLHDQQARRRVEQARAGDQAIDRDGHDPEVGGGGHPVAVPWRESRASQEQPARESTIPRHMARTAVHIRRPSARTMAYNIDFRARRRNSPLHPRRRARGASGAGSCGPSGAWRGRAACAVRQRSGRAAPRRAAAYSVRVVDERGVEVQQQVGEAASSRRRSRRPPARRAGWRRCWPGA